MYPTTTIRFFSATNFNHASQRIDQYMSQIKDWEIVSVSHVLVANTVSIACVLKYTGQDRDQASKLLPDTDNDNSI